MRASWAIPIQCERYRTGWARIRQRCDGQLTCSTQLSDEPAATRQRNATAPIPSAKIASAFCTRLGPPGSVKDTRAAGRVTQRLRMAAPTPGVWTTFDVEVDRHGFREISPARWESIASNTQPLSGSRKKMRSKRRSELVRSLRPPPADAPSTLGSRPAVGRAPHGLALALDGRVPPDALCATSRTAFARPGGAEMLVRRVRPEVP